MFSLVEKGFRSGICHAIHQYAEANNKYMKILIKLYLMYWHGNFLYGWEVL